MIILGLNMFHSDASAALVVDGEVVFAVAEERLNRIKHFAGFPKLSIQACLDAAGISMGDVDHVAVGRDPQANLERKLLYGLRNPRTLVNLTKMRLQGVRRFSDFRSEMASALEVDPSTLRFQQHNVEHHVAHIASAYFCSPWERAAGFSYDGSGDWVTTMFARCSGNDITVTDRVFIPHSLGVFYSMVSSFIGYDSYGDEGKVMGLAALGTDALSEEIGKLVQDTRDSYRLDLSYFERLGSNPGIEILPDGRITQPRLFSPRMEQHFGTPRVRHSDVTQRDMDLAFALQQTFERVTLRLLRRLSEETGDTNLAMAGGCALNSVVNGKIFDETAFRQTWIQPAAGDEGLSVGAALYCLYSILGAERTYEMTNAYLGPSFSDTQMRGALDAAGISYEEHPEDVLKEKVVDHLAAGDVVGWFQGRMEWGPRALGNRSILAHPGLPDMKDTLNARIKHREWFRPFAPSILEERVADYFEETHPSPFMLHAYPIKPGKRDELAAVTHVDGTGRLQTVSASENPAYHALIRAFERRTGTPVVLNTSFNENEPIVCTPREAVDCFVRTRMDVLAIGPFLAVKRGEG